MEDRIMTLKDLANRDDSISNLEDWLRASGRPDLAHSVYEIEDTHVGMEWDGDVVYVDFDPMTDVCDVVQRLCRCSCAG